MWFKLLQRVGLQFLALQIDEEFFDDWWERINLNAGYQLQKGLNPLVILGTWTFIVISVCLMEFLQSLARALLLAREELFLGGLAWARGMSYLGMAMGNYPLSMCYPYPYP